MLAHREQTAGQDLIEYALILPLLLLLLLGIMEFGIVVFSYNTISNAAREVARFGIVHPTDSAIQSFIDDDLPERIPGLNPAAVAVSPAPDASGYISGMIVGVTVTYDAALITAPMIQAVGGDGVIHLRAVARMRRE